MTDDDVLTVLARIAERRNGEVQALGIWTGATCWTACVSFLSITLVSCFAELTPTAYRVCGTLALIPFGLAVLLCSRLFWRAELIHALYVEAFAIDEARRTAARETNRVVAKHLTARAITRAKLALFRKP